jgi:hypothetical protein
VTSQTLVKAELGYPENCRPVNYRRRQVLWVKGHAGTLGNEKVDALAGRAVEKASWSLITSIAHLKLYISERYGAAKENWHGDPTDHGAEEIPPPPPKKSCLDVSLNALAWTTAQIRTGHWRSAVFILGDQEESG